MPSKELCDRYPAIDASIEHHVTSRRGQMKPYELQCFTFECRQKVCDTHVQKFSVIGNSYTPELIVLAG